MSQNLQICGLCFIALCMMYYLLVDVFEKSKRLRQAAVLHHELVIEPAKAAVILPSVPQESVYPMYIDCSRHTRIIPPHSNNVLNPVTI